MKKIIASLLVFVYVFISFGIQPVSATVGDNLVMSLTVNENVFNKLHFYVDADEQHHTIDNYDELKCAVDGISIKDTSIVLCDNSDNNTNDCLEVTVEFASDFMQTEQYLEFSAERQNLNSMEEVREFRKKLNSYSKIYHENLINQNVHTLQDMEYVEMTTIQYSPFVVLTMEPEQLDTDVFTELCYRDNVKHISVGYPPTGGAEASWDETLAAMNAYNVVSDETFTGNGVRIGVYEWDGVCDEEHPNLVDKDITLKNSASSRESHGTIVTCALAAIAPDAEFYVGEVENQKPDLSWFIEQECDIVNCSFGVYRNIDNGNNTYSLGPRSYQYDIDGLFDYQIQAHFLIVCVSAGNVDVRSYSHTYNPNGDITSPGYAYNAITVGGVDREYIDSAYRWTHSDDACYVASAPKVKPNISAPYLVTIPGCATAAGTSVSSPLVAGCIALFLEAHSEYAAFPEAILSIIALGATKTYDFSATVSSFDAKVGAGIINLQEMLGSYYEFSKNNQNRTAGIELMSKELYVPIGTTLRISLAWIVTVDRDNEVIYLTDYDIRLYDPSGALVATSNLGNSNIERITKTITQAGTYRIVVYQFGAMNQNVTADWMSLSYDY